MERGALRTDIVVGDNDDECLRQRLERCYDCPGQVTITGFCASKSLIQLMIYILKSAPLVEYLMLDTTYLYDMRFGHNLSLRYEVWYH